MASPFVRRFLPAVGVALAVALLGFGAIGLASAESAADDGLPATFRLAERHAGDKGVYSVVHESLGVGGERREAEERFVWLEEQPFLDGRDGTWHAAHGRLLDSDFSTQFTVGDVEVVWDLWWIDWVETSTGQSIGQSGVLGGWVSSSWARSPLVAFGTSQQETSLHTGTSWHDGQSCTLEGLLVAGVDLDGPIELPASCQDGDEPAAYVATRSQVDGVPTVRFTMQQEGDRWSFWEAVEYAEGIPEPLLSEWQSTHDGEVVYRGSSRLVGFEQGTGDWDTGLELPSPLPLPAIELAPRDPWGPSEAGIQHPFPASQAWQAAKDDPTYTDFRDYLTAHPDALAAIGQYDEEREGNQTHRTWSFIVQPDGTGEGDGFWLVATQTTGPAGAMATDLLGLPAQAPMEASSYSFHGFESSFRMGEELSQQLPTVASLMARWQAHTGSSQAANGWSFDQFDVTAGLAGMQVPAQRVQDLVTGSQRSGNASFLHLAVSADGTPSRLIEEERTTNYDVSGLTGTPPQGVPPAETPSDDGPRVVVAGIAWSPPAAPAASGAAAASLLAGLLYWLWPAVKGGAVGLFSRIESPRLLDHPVRRSIVDVVEAQPGIHYQAILRTVGGGKGAVEHHLGKLVAAGLLRRHRGPGYTCYFPAGTDRRVAAAAGVLKADGARRVLAAASGRPGASSVDLAQATGLDASTVSHHVHRLAAAGLVRTTREGRTLRVDATDLAGSALAAS